MHAPTEGEVREALARFPLGRTLRDLRPLRRGHIHDTFVSSWDADGGTRTFVHQRINRSVFPNVELLMRNVRRVSEHLARQGDAGGFEPLRLVLTATGATHAETPSGPWRTFVFIADTVSHDRCTGPDQAFEAARAFGWFQVQLEDLPAEELGETLPGFFSSPLRFAQFEAALAAAPDGRRRSASDAIAFALDRSGMVGVIEDRLARGTIPRRVIHGDTKLNNVLFDRATGRARSIVDLDTCMAGYSLYDFGDLVRFTAATSDEDERDLSRVGTDLELYRALADGYLASASGLLLPEEIELMPFAARLVTLTIGLRFLTDHLAGDVYFKTERPDHNLDRARVQFGMVACMERNAERMRP